MIVAGFGFRAATTADSLLQVFDAARGSHRVAALATAADKAQTDVFKTAAARIGLPAQPVGADLLGEQSTTTRSDASLSHRDTGSVAEAAALAAAGPGARLIVPRMISEDRMATCALAEGDPT